MSDNVCVCVHWWPPKDHAPVLYSRKSMWCSKIENKKYCISKYQEHRAGRTEGRCCGELDSGLGRVLGFVLVSLSHSVWSCFLPIVSHRSNGVLHQHSLRYPGTPSQPSLQPCSAGEWEAADPPQRNLGWLSPEPKSSCISVALWAVVPAEELGGFLSCAHSQVLTSSSPSEACGPWESKQGASNLCCPSH